MPSERVKQFYECDSFAIVGVSRKEKNIAWSIYEQLVERGKRVYAVNPGEGSYGGIRFYGSLAELPETPEAIILSLDLRKAKGILEELKDSEAKYIWFQQGSFDDELLSEAKRLGLDPIKGCALMNMPNAQFMHRFHRAINELFGKGYK
jgi:predicted CoA-binding protein